MRTPLALAALILAAACTRDSTRPLTLPNIAGVWSLTASTGTVSMSYTETAQLLITQSDISFSGTSTNWQEWVTFGGTTLRRFIPGPMTVLGTVFDTRVISFSASDSSGGNAFTFAGSLVTDSRMAGTMVKCPACNPPDSGAWLAVKQ